MAVQVSRPVADALAGHGGHCNRMGDEAVLDLESFDASLSGGKWETKLHSRGLRSLAPPRTSRPIGVDDSRAIRAHRRRAPA